MPQPKYALQVQGKVRHESFICAVSGMISGVVACICEDESFLCEDESFISWVVDMWSWVVYIWSWVIYTWRWQWVIFSGRSHLRHECARLWICRALVWTCMRWVVLCVVVFSSLVWSCMRWVVLALLRKVTCNFVWSFMKWVVVYDWLTDVAFITS